MHKHRPLIFVILGVTKADHKRLDEMFDQRYSAPLVGSSVSELDLQRQPLPALFLGLDTWPLTTNLLCWHCSLGFKTRPVFIPDDVIGEALIEQQQVLLLDRDRAEATPAAEQEQQATAAVVAAKVNGCFCTFNCAAAFIRDKYTGRAHDNKMMMLLWLYEVFNGCRARLIKPAPAPTVQFAYCGTADGISAHEYQRRLLEQANNELLTNLRAPRHQISFG